MVAEREKPTHEVQVKIWECCIEVVDWRRRIWTINYSKQFVRGGGWTIDWEVLSPDGKVKASKENDTALAERCTIDESIDPQWLWYEFKTWIGHYNNVIDVKKLKAEQAR
ncbi:MAG TPA: hypothetical protein V6D33_09090 [Cyanophyceae cyanobacterium]